MASQEGENRRSLKTAKQCKYAKCYCEENVWWMCKELKESELSNADVIFVSNADRTIPIWCQKAANQSGFVVWDYHVILALRVDGENLVYDLDTTLPFPCTFAEYSSMALKEDQKLLPQFHRKFRIVQAKDYLTHFASDRSHMRKKDGGWLAEPPSYPPIKSLEQSNNLQEYINMSENVAGEPHSWLGYVKSLQQLNNYYGP